MNLRNSHSKSARAVCAAWLSLLFALPVAAAPCYVIGDTSGNNPSKPPGGKHNPYGSLSQVEADNSCLEIIVLYSAVPLDGGILLKDGQKLLGKPGPAEALPVISNTSDSGNGGNAVTLATNNRIEDLHIRDSYNSAVVGAEVGEFAIENSLITNFGQSEVLTATAAGLVLSPPGIAVLSASDVNIKVLETEIGDAKGAAIRIVALTGNADIVIDRVTVQNLGAVAGSHISPGINVFGAGDAIVDTVVRDSSVINIGEGLSNSDGMLFIAFRSATFDLLVDNYSYSNPDGDGGGSATGLEIGTEFGQGTHFDATVRNSTFHGGTSIGIQVIDQGEGTNNFLTAHIHDNEFYDTAFSAIEIDIGFGAAFGTDIFTIENNLIVNPGGSGIELFSVFEAQSLVNMLVQKNTILNSALYGMRFSQVVGASAATLNLDAGLGALGSIGRNTIIGSQVADVYVETFDCCGFPTTPPFEVSAANNWWGSADGPVNVLEDGGASVDVTPFLTEEP